MPQATQPFRPTIWRQRLLLAIVPLTLLFAGCDFVQQKIGFEDPAAKAAKEEAEGKAVGAACRHSGRAIEDCYSIYRWLPKAAIFEGWQEMDTYMRENKIEEVEPQLPPPPPPAAVAAAAAKKPATASADDDAPSEKSAEKK